MRVPIDDVKNLANKWGLTHCIVFGWDGKNEQVLTWGHDIPESAQAADFGNKLKDTLGWPKNLHRQPPRIKQLQARVKELEAYVKQLKGKPAIVESMFPTPTEPIVVTTASTGTGCDHE